ncbi:MAG: diguanylate cyclase [Bacillota bacterium]|jgi:diguanylate cyclase (GGDEF)-like protein
MFNKENYHFALLLFINGVLPLTIFYCAEKNTSGNNLKFFLFSLFISTILSLFFIKFTPLPVVKKKEPKPAPPLILQSNTDDLTGLYNRRYFYDQLDWLLSPENPSKKPFILALANVGICQWDHSFLGHIIAERITVSLAKIIKHNVPVNVIVSGYGPGRFGLIFPEYTTFEAKNLLSQLGKHIEEFSLQKSPETPLTKISFIAGTACFPNDGANKSQLLNHADLDLQCQQKSHQVTATDYLSAAAEIQSNSDQELLRFARFILFIINARDNYTLGHTERVMKYSVAIANALELPKDEINNIKMGAALHDIGKMELPRHILNKDIPLTLSEWRDIRDHPLWGVKIMTSVPGTEHLLPLIKHHHERFDGDGYPSHLSKTDIPLGARIIAVADSFDAMTNHRPYRKKKTIPEALLELRKHAGKQWDPEIVQIFMEIAEKVVKF